MRTISLTGGSAYIPDTVVYAFNPNYVQVNLSGQTGIVKLAVSDRSHEYEIDATLYQGVARCYVSRLLQLLFDDYLNTRSKTVTITVRNASGTMLGSGSCIVLWASLEAGMTYGYYLPMVSDRNGAGRALREIVWFTGLPFTVSVFDNVNITELQPSRVSQENIKLIRSSAMEGTYLRWIDNYGFWQYYLFDTGVRQSKNKLGSTSVDTEYTVDGVNHQAQRCSHIENTDTVKCCAVSMKREILAYVETIYKSPHIDMYVGKVNNKEVWKPVNIVAGTVNVADDGKLFDYEISFTLPQTQVQEL